MPHSATPNGGDESRYDLTVEGAVQASDCVSFMQSADMDLDLPPEDDPGCGGCLNCEHCGFCPCCAPIDTVERDDLLAVIHEAHEHLSAVERLLTIADLPVPMALIAAVDSLDGLHVRIAAETP